MRIHFQLATTRKGNLSVIDYFQRMKSLADTLAYINCVRIMCKSILQHNRIGTLGGGARILVEGGQDFFF
jgi:hypothetical protein